MEPQKQIELSVVMPCLNEAATLETCIRKARACLEAHRIRGEVLIGDNGSTDGSQDIARRCGARVVDVPQRGYGAAIHGAMTQARGAYAIIGDSDDSYDFSDLMPFLQELREGCDLVMGNRFDGGIEPGAMPWKNRYIGNPILSWIGRLFFRCPVRDFHCGLRGISLSAYRKLDVRTTGMEFASEMVIKATLHGMKIVEVPTTLSPDGRTGASHLRPWHDGWRHLRFMLLYSPRWLFLYPGVVLMLIGALAGLWLYPGPRRVGAVTFDVHTMLYAAVAIILGFNAVMFAAFTKVFAISEGLLPEDPKFNRLFDYITLETGLIVGAIFTTAGFGASAAMFLHWNERSFGDLEPTLVLRRVIPAITALCLGVEIILASFFLSVLGLRRRK